MNFQIMGCEDIFFESWTFNSPNLLKYDIRAIVEPHTQHAHFPILQMSCELVVYAFEMLNENHTFRFLKPHAWMKTIQKYKLSLIAIASIKKEISSPIWLPLKYMWEKRNKKTSSLCTCASPKVHFLWWAKVDLWVW